MSYALSAAIPVLSGRWGRIVSKDGWSYQITDDDVLWLARSAQYEGGTNTAAVIWTYAQRLSLPSVRSRYSTLASLVRAHSQPVNPKWSRTGEFCAPGGRYHGTEHCSENRLKRRDEAQTIPWESISERVRDLVVRFARADLPNPVPRSVEFAAGDLSREDTVTGYLSRNPGARVVLRAGNWFIATAQSLLWPEDQVIVEYDGKVSRIDGKSMFWMFGVLAVVTGVVLWWRSRR